MPCQSLQFLSVLTFFLAPLMSNGTSAQEPTTIDFARDVPPLFQTHCIECHGPEQQNNGLRLDRRRDDLRGETVNMIGPGNADASRLYLRLIGESVGPQMPPDGPLSPDEIQVIKDWIDQGAVWPDAVSGETPAPPPDPAAMKWVRPP